MSKYSSVDTQNPNIYNLFSLARRGRHVNFNDPAVTIVSDFLESWTMRFASEFNARADGMESKHCALIVWEWQPC